MPATGPSPNLMGMPTVQFSLHLTKDGHVLSSDADQVWNLENYWVITPTRPLTIFNRYDQYPTAPVNFQISIRDFCWRHENPNKQITQCLEKFTQEVVTEFQSVNRRYTLNTDRKTKLESQTPSSTQKAEIRKVERKLQTFTDRRRIIQVFAQNLLSFVYAHTNVFRDRFAEADEAYKGFFPSDTPAFESWMNPYKRGVKTRVSAAHFSDMANSFHIMDEIITKIFHSETELPGTTMVVSDSLKKMIRRQYVTYLAEAQTAWITVAKAKVDVQADPTHPSNWADFSFADIIDEYLMTQSLQESRTYSTDTLRITDEDHHSLSSTTLIAETDQEDNLVSFMNDDQQVHDFWQVKELNWADEVEMNIFAPLKKKM